MKTGYQFNDTFPSRKKVIEDLLAMIDYRPGTEIIPVREAAGRVSAEDMHAVHSIPVKRASCLDGIAVRSEAFRNGMPDTAGWKKGVDYVRADTGDDFPDEFDAAIRIECVDIREDGGVDILDDLEILPGSGVKPAGGTVSEGQLIVKRGRILRAVELSALVMGGITEVPVYRKPAVAFIPTGNELIAPGETLKRGNNIDSNSILAETLLREFGAEPVMYPIVKDNRRDLRKILEEAMQTADLVLINGGSSMGSEDFNGRLIEEMGHTVAHGVMAAPGKPVCAGIIDGKPVINVPGPPVGVFYVMNWLVRQVIRNMLGLPPYMKRTVRAFLTEDIVTPYNVEIMCRMHTVRKKDGSYETREIPFKASPAPVALCSNSCYITRPGTSGNKAGEYIDVELLMDDAFISE